MAVHSPYPHPHLSRWAAHPHPPLTRPLWGKRTQSAPHASGLMHIVLLSDRGSHVTIGLRTEKAPWHVVACMQQCRLACIATSARPTCMSRVWKLCWTAPASRLQSAERLAATLDSFTQVRCSSLLTSCSSETIWHHPAFHALYGQSLCISQL
jgi:hypothetical protein